MARDEFFRDIRRAVSFMAPRVEADSPFTDTRYIERMLQGTDMWLAQGFVQAFRPDDFPDLDEKTRETLTRSVSDFLTVARDVPSNKSASSEQRNTALPPFMKIAQTVQGLLCADSSVGARHRIHDAWRINVHAARKYRNQLIHDEDSEGDPVTLPEARRYLGRFFGCLPDNW